MNFHKWLIERLDLDKTEFETREDIENEAYRICVEDMAEGNKEDGAGYWENLNDEYKDEERRKPK
jgi:hypothetical protein